MSNKDCLFCKIANKELSTDIIYENEYCLAFNDIKPASPIHILVIPKKHYKNLTEVDDEKLLSKLLQSVQEIVKEKKLAEEGFRTVINTNNNGGQTVYHLHIHILAGRFHTWPPG